MATAAEPTVGKFVGAENNKLNLQLDLPGFLVLGNIDSSRSIVTPGPTILLGETSGAHAKDASQAVDVWQNGAATSPLVQVTARNDFAALADNKAVHIEYTGDGWALGAGECV